jgi:hypothetical protein
MKSILLFSVLLLGTSWAVAQNSTNPRDSNQGNSSQMAGDQGAKQSVEGCLSGSDGNYVLTANDGTTYQLMGDNSTLSEHVGHTIKVRGAISPSTASPSGENTGGGTGANSGRQSIQVSSVKHISKTCQNSGGMSH